MSILALVSSNIALSKLNDKWTVSWLDIVTPIIKIPLIIFFTVQCRSPQGSSIIVTTIDNWYLDWISKFNYISENHLWCDTHIYFSHSATMLLFSMHRIIFPWCISAIGENFPPCLFLYFCAVCKHQLTLSPVLLLAFSLLQWYFVWLM